MEFSFCMSDNLISGNFKAGTFLPFHQPSFILDLYPSLLGTEDGDKSGIPLVLSMFYMEARRETLEEDWEGSGSPLPLGFAQINLRSKAFD